MYNTRPDRIDRCTCEHPYESFAKIFLRILKESAEKLNSERLGPESKRSRSTDHLRNFSFSGHLLFLQLSLRVDEILTPQDPQFTRSRVEASCYRNSSNFPTGYRLRLSSNFGDHPGCDDRALRHGHLATPGENRNGINRVINSRTTLVAYRREQYRYPRCTRRDTHIAGQ